MLAARFFVALGMGLRIVLTLTNLANLHTLHCLSVCLSKVISDLHVTHASTASCMSYELIGVWAVLFFLFSMFNKRQ